VYKSFCIHPNRLKVELMDEKDINYIHLALSSCNGKNKNILNVGCLKCNKLLMHSKLEEEEENNLYQPLFMFSLSKRKYKQEECRIIQLYKWPAGLVAI